MIFFPSLVLLYFYFFQTTLLYFTSFFFCFFFHLFRSLTFFLSFLSFLFFSSQGVIEWKKSVFDCTGAPWSLVVEALLSNTPDRSESVTLVFERPLESEEEE